MDMKKEFIKLVSTQEFRTIIDSDIITIVELNAAIALLTKLNFDYDVIFVSGTRREFPEAILTVFITPVTNIDFTVILFNC